MKRVLAFDLGASSGRGIIAEIKDGKIQLSEIHRFANNGVAVRGTLYWDILYLFDQIKQGIVKAKNAGGFDCIGIDTWGVDFGLLDENGELICNPVHYRDSRTDGIPDEVFKIINKESLYQKTGIQILNFNTLFQLYYLTKYKGDLLKRAKKLLFIPDLLNYFLTGVAKNEYTISSTSQMLDPYTKKWDNELLGELDIPSDILCEIAETGSILGKVSNDLCEELGIDGAEVVAVGAHDTASAVVSVPTETEDFVYISCGTWALFGTELKKPFIKNEGLYSSYTNEGGYNYTTRFLTNIMGLWLIQESRRWWNKQGNDYSFNDLEKQALACEPFKCFIDPDCEDFAKPGNLPGRIQKFCERTGQYVPQTVGETVRCIYESIALKYKYSFNNLKKLTGKDFSCIHIVGGGTKDGLLCRLTADACNTTVYAGPIEATALGNIAVQLMSLGEIKDIGEARRLIKSSFDVKEFSACDASSWDNVYDKFVNILK